MPFRDADDRGTHNIVFHLNQIFVGGLDQEVNDADFRAYFAK